MRRRMFFRGFTLVELIGVVVILGLIALVALPPILNSVRKTKGNISDASQKILYSATEVYVSENINSYPRTDGNVYCITIGSLVSNNLLPTKVYDAVTGEEIGQDNIVEVTVNQGQYSYSLNNNCVEKKAVSLIQTLLAKYSEGATNGLVNDTTDSSVYYFKGSNSQVNNNYLWYGGHSWRVIEFDTSDNTLLLISQQPLTTISPASAVWTTQSAYESSYINSWLNDYFYNSLSSSVKNNIVNNTFNIGTYSDVDEITTTQKVGLLDEDQYTRAGSTDSYLDIKDYFWLGNSSSSSYVRNVASNGGLGISFPSGGGGVRPVIRISDQIITGGNGTLTSNYEVETKATNTSNVQVGEYINVPYNGSDGACGSDKMCTFRVVSKDSDSIKVILNGLLPSTSAYGSNATITTSHTIYTPLNTFANNISTTYRYSGSNKVFYSGDYPSGSNYTDVQDDILYATVGLPTVGEMFSGNDIDMSTSNSKTFVNVSTIENPTVDSYYWTMNRYSSSFVRSSNSSGSLGYYGPSDSFGVRPVIYLKSGTSALTFTGGNGTAQNPYTLT